MRHNQALKEVARQIEEVRAQPVPQEETRDIIFVKEGTRPPGHSRSSLVRAGLLQTASDWVIKVDIGRQLKFPEQIVPTSLRPDLVLTSNSTKTVIVVELTVPWEDRFEESHELKKAKYEDLLAEARFRGWRTYCFPVEVGC